MRAAEAETGLPQIVYVAGANRSGTTLLDILLSQHANVVSGGELFQVLRILEDVAARCSCGELVRECAVWRPIIADIEALAAQRGARLGALIRPLRRLENRSALAAYRKGGRPAADDLQLYASINRTIMQHLAGSKAETRYLVDSSKSHGGTAGRALVLSRFLGLDLRIIHLVRNADGVVASALKGSNKEIEQGIRTARSWRGLGALADWGRANMSAWRLGREIGADKILRIELGQLMAQPEASVRKIGEFLGLDPQDILDALDREELGRTQHIISGNRMRFGPTRLEPERASSFLPWYFRAPCALANWLVLGHRIWAPMETER